MNKVLSDLLTDLQLADPQQYQHIVVFPLRSAINHSPDYWTLPEALEQRLLEVKEIGQQGSVPELKVANRAEKPVLLLDGEELSGAKQNRVLNTSILAPPKQELIIPVSCTEQGRWNYVSSEFAESGNVMPNSLRARKSRSVSESLEHVQGFQSDQGEVWAGVDMLAVALEAPSATGAMKDVYEARRADLDTALRAFPLLPEQKGLLVLINGVSVGFDFVSLAPAFARLHSKLVKSYVMDALTRKPKKAKSPAVAREQAQAFMAEAVASGEKQFKSIGLGDDYRCKGKGLVGSALIDQEKVIHTAFFRVDDGEETGNMSAMNRRRSYRVS